MKIGDIVKNAPNALIYSVALCFVAILAAFTVLSATGSDATELRSFITLTMSLAAGLFSGGSLIVAGSAAKSSAATEQQTNGTLTAKDQEIARLRAIIQGEPVERSGD
jgi:hypothetical protein